MNNRGLLLGLCVGIVLVGATLPRAAEKRSGAATVAIVANKDFLEFRSGPDVVTRYYVSSNLAKPYFFPLKAPGTACITRSWPMEPAEPNEATDHPHQKSAWFCHGDVILEGLNPPQKTKGVHGIDFWSPEVTHSGQIACVRVGDVDVRGNHGRVSTINEWRAAGGQKVLDETRVIHLYDFGEARLLVLDIDLLASNGNVTFGDTKEGSMGVRLRNSVTEKKGKGVVTNAEGKSPSKNAWGYISAWCDYSGPVEGKTAGITLFADPANPIPSCWHCRDYGLMAANPFGREVSGFPAMKGRTDLVRLSRGEHLKLRFGIFLHTGDVKEGKVAEYYQRFTKLKG